MTQHHGRLSTYMGIIKRTAELTREPSSARSAAMGLVKTGHSADRDGAMGFGSNKERESGHGGP